MNRIYHTRVTTPGTSRECRVRAFVREWSGALQSGGARTDSRAEVAYWPKTAKSEAKSTKMQENQKFKTREPRCWTWTASTVDRRGSCRRAAGEKRGGRTSYYGARWAARRTRHGPPRASALRPLRSPLTNKRSDTTQSQTQSGAITDVTRVKTNFFSSIPYLQHEHRVTAPARLRTLCCPKVDDL